MANSARGSFLAITVLPGPQRTLSWGRAAPGLRNVFSYGHCCDLTLTVVSRTLKAIQRWTGQRAKEGATVTLRQATVAKLGTHLAKWGPWQATRRGVSKGRTSFQFLAQRRADPSDKAIHELRGFHSLKAGSLRAALTRTLPDKRS